MGQILGALSYCQGTSHPLHSLKHSQMAKSDESQVDLTPDKWGGWGQTVAYKLIHMNRTVSQLKLRCNHSKPPKYPFSVPTIHRMVSPDTAGRCYSYSHFLYAR